MMNFTSMCLKTEDHKIYSEAYLMSDMVKAHTKWTVSLTLGTISTEILAN